MIFYQWQWHVLVAFEFLKACVCYKVWNWFWGHISYFNFNYILIVLGRDSFFQFFSLSLFLSLLLILNHIKRANRNKAKCVLLIRSISTDLVLRLQQFQQKCHKKQNDKTKNENVSNYVFRFFFFRRIVVFDLNEVNLSPKTERHILFCSQN